MGESAFVTAGQLLVSLSGLSGVSAGAHLMAITAGTGRIVFASSFTVTIDEQQLVVNLSDKELKPVRQVVEAQPTTSKKLKRLFVVTQPEELTISTQPNTLNIVEVKR